MITYTFKDPGYFYVLLEKIVSYEDIISYLIDFAKIDYLPLDLCVLYNMEKVKLDIQIEEISEISDLAAKVTSKYKSVKTALVVSNPDVTVYSILFQSNTKPQKTKRKTFSTEEAAINWLTEEC